MATRTIENARDRLVTILVAPLMSCSARLPVYLLMIATLLPGDVVPATTKAGIMLAMYALGTGGVSSSPGCSSARSSRARPST
jgi:ferrous iron transport protein B